jgi:hypothetical protein
LVIAKISNTRRAHIRYRNVSLENVYKKEFGGLRQNRKLRRGRSGSGGRGERSKAKEPGLWRNENNKMYVYILAKPNENNEVPTGIGLFSFVLAFFLLRGRLFPGLYAWLRGRIAFVFFFGFLQPEPPIGNIFVDGLNNKRK